MDELNNKVIHHLQIFGQLCNNERYKIIIQDIILEYRKVPISTTYLDTISMIYDYLVLDSQNCLRYLISSDLLTQLINLFYALHYLNHSINYESTISMIYLFELLLELCKDNRKSSCATNSREKDIKYDNNISKILSVNNLCMNYKLGHTLFLILYLKDLKYSFKYRELLFKMLSSLTLVDLLNSSIFNNYIVAPFLKIANLKDLMSDTTIVNPSNNNNDPKNGLIQIQLSIRLISELNLNYETIEQFNLFEAMLIYFKFYNDTNKLESFTTNIQVFQSINQYLLKVLTDNLLPELIHNEYFFDLIYFLLKCLNNEVSRIRKDHKGSINKTIHSTNVDMNNNNNSIFFDLSFKVEIIKFFKIVKSKYLLKFNFLKFSNVLESVISLLNHSMELSDDIEILEFLEDLLNNYTDGIEFAMSSKQLIKLSDKIDNLFFNISEKYTFIEEPCQLIQSQRFELAELYLKLLSDDNFINLLNRNTNEKKFSFALFFTRCQFFECFNSLYLLKRQPCLSVFLKHFQYYDADDNPSMIKSLIIEYNKTLVNKDDQNLQLQTLLIDRIYEILLKATNLRKQLNQKHLQLPYNQRSLGVVELDNNLNNLKFLELALSSSNGNDNLRKFKTIAIYLIFENVEIFAHLIIKNFVKLAPNFDEMNDLNMISLLIVTRFLEHVKKNPQPIEYLFLKNSAFISFFKKFNDTNSISVMISKDNYAEILLLINNYIVLEDSMFLLQKKQQYPYQRIISYEALLNIFISIVNIFGLVHSNIQGSSSIDYASSSTGNNSLNVSIEIDPFGNSENVVDLKSLKNEELENEIPFFIELLNFLNSYEKSMTNSGTNIKENDIYYFRMLEIFSYGILFNKNLKTFQKFIMKLNKKNNNINIKDDLQKIKIFEFFQKLISFIINSVDCYTYRNLDNKLNKFLVTMEVYLIFGHIMVNLNNFVTTNNNEKGHDEDDDGHSNMFIWDFLHIFSQLNERNIEFNKQIILFGKTNIILSLLNFASSLVSENFSNESDEKDLKISNKLNLIFKNFKLFINDFKNFKSIFKKEIIEKLITIFYNGVKQDELQHIKFKNDKTANNNDSALVDYYSKELMINCLFPCLITFFYKPSNNTNNNNTNSISNQIKPINDILDSCMKILTMHPTNCTILEFFWKCIYFYSFISELKINTINFVINDLMAKIYDGKLGNLFYFKEQNSELNSPNTDTSSFELYYYIIASIYQLCLNDDGNNNSNQFINFEGYSYTNSHGTATNNNIYRIRKKNAISSNSDAVKESHDDINLTLFSYLASKLDMRVNFLNDLLNLDCLKDNHNNNILQDKKSDYFDDADAEERKVMRTIIIDDLNAFKEIVVNCNLFNDSLNLRRSLAVRKH